MQKLCKQFKSLNNSAVKNLLFEKLTVKLVKLSSRRYRDLLGNWCCLGVVALSRRAFSSLCVSL